MSFRWPWSIDTDRYQRVSLTPAALGKQVELSEKFGALCRVQPHEQNRHPQNRQGQQSQAPRRRFDQADLHGASASLNRDQVARHLERRAARGARQPSKELLPRAAHFAKNGNFLAHACQAFLGNRSNIRSEEHSSELQSPMYL